MEEEVMKEDMTAFDDLLDHLTPEDYVDKN